MALRSRVWLDHIISFSRPVQVFEARVSQARAVAGPFAEQHDYSRRPRLELRGRPSAISPRGPTYRHEPTKANLLPSGDRLPAPSLYSGRGHRWPAPVDPAPGGVKWEQPHRDMLGLPVKPASFRRRTSRTGCRARVRSSSAHRGGFQRLRIDAHLPNISRPSKCALEVYRLPRIGPGEFTIHAQFLHLRPTIRLRTV